MEKVKLQKENLNAANEVVKFLKRVETATVTQCQEVMWDNKHHINGSKRRFKAHFYHVRCPRGRGLGKNYENIWTWLFNNNFIKVTDNPNDARKKTVSLK